MKDAKTKLVIFMAVFLVLSLTYMPLYHAHAVTYNLSLSVSGAGGANPAIGYYIGPSIEYFTNGETVAVEEGLQVQIYGFPAIHYIFDHALIDGVTTESSSPFNVTMDAAHTVVIYFSAGPTPTPGPTAESTPTPTATATPAPTTPPTPTPTVPAYTPAPSFIWPPPTGTPHPTSTTPPVPTPPPSRSGLEIHTAATGVYIQFNNSQRLIIQDLIRATEIHFTITDGTFNGTLWLNVDGTLGNLTVLIDGDSGSIYMSNTNNTVAVTANGAVFSGTYTTTYTDGTYFIVTWVTVSIPVVIDPFGTGINTDWLWSLLLSMDFIGFILGCWTYSLGQSFYVLALLIVGGIFYIKTKSLLYMVIIWVLFGSIMIGLAGVDMTSPLIYFLVAFGIATFLYKLFNHET